MRRWKLAATLAGAVLVVSAGCHSTSTGGGVTGGPGAATGSPSATGSPDSSPATTVVVNKSVWYGGMKMTFGSVASAPGLVLHALPGPGG